MTDREKEKMKELLERYQEFTQTDKKSKILELSLCIVSMVFLLCVLISASVFDLSFSDFSREKQPFVIVNIAVFIATSFIWGTLTFFSTLSISKSVWRIVLALSLFFSLFISLNFYANLEFNIALKKIDVSEMQKFKEDTSKSGFLNFWFAFDKQNAIQRIDEKIQNVKLEQQSEELKKLEAMKQIWEGKNEKR